MLHSCLMLIKDGSFASIAHSTIDRSPNQVSLLSTLLCAFAHVWISGDRHTITTIAYTVVWGPAFREKSICNHFTNRGGKVTLSEWTEVDIEDGTVEWLFAKYI